MTVSKQPVLHPAHNEPLWKRLWIYQESRFPLFRTALLLLVFSAASLSVSSHLGQRPLPSFTTFAVIWAMVLIIFFQMRACDEWKDLEDDAKYRPERPIPGGLVSLGMILGIALAGVPLALLLAGSLEGGLLWLLALVWGWLLLMTAEFFAPHWLKARPLLYLVSHMAIMPLIDLFITAGEWLPHGWTPPHGLWLFLALSFVNGTVIELGRKIWAPENERDGVETYSALLGPRRAAWAFMGVVALSYALLVGVGVAVGAPLVIALAGFIMLALVIWNAHIFVKAPTKAHQARIDAMAGLWVFACYALAGFAPLIHAGGLS